jgi:SAM-dependent methyltransferase
MSTSTQDFYDALAPFYHLIFPDWEASIARQAAALDAVIRAELGGGARTVLDAACGIGTQSLGFAALGHDVTASDLSPGAVRRLREEAARRGVTIDARVADMRALADAHGGRRWEVVLCADNALPHLLTDGEIVQALREMHRCTAPGGICLVSIRDYAAIDLQSARLHPYGVREADGARWVLFQVWDPRPPLYDTSFYVVEDRGGTADTRVMRATYYALPVPRLVELMAEAGFNEVRTLDDDAFYQPLVLGRRGGDADADG